jgi:Na+-transporting NADH:ubiquinone oxidoreductase subunit NqrC
MFSSSVIVATIAGVAAFSGVIVTTITQMINTRRNQDFELDKEKFKLEFEKFHERDNLTRKKLEKAHTAVPCQ